MTSTLERNQETELICHCQCVVMDMDIAIADQLRKLTIKKKGKRAVRFLQPSADIPNNINSANDQNKPTILVHVNPDRRCQEIKIFHNQGVKTFHARDVTHDAYDTTHKCMRPCKKLRPIQNAVSPRMDMPRLKI